MSDLPAPSLSLRIRPRSLPPGVASTPPMVRPEVDAATISAEMKGSLSQTGATGGTGPVSASNSASPVASSSAVEEPKVKFGLRPAEAPKPTMNVPPPLAPSPAPLNAQKAVSGPVTVTRPPMTPMGPTSIEEPIKVEDSRLFRIGVRFFFLLGVAFVVFLGWLAWFFIQHREKPAVPPSEKTAVDPTPVPTPTPAAKPKAAVATPAQQVGLFEDFVAHLKIAGVAGGARPKALINGAMYTPGQVIDPITGVVVESIDATKREIIFRDNRNERLKRRY